MQEAALSAYERLHTLKNDEHFTGGRNMDEQNNQTIIEVNFPITSYDNAQKLIFVVEWIEEVELVKNR